MGYRNAKEDEINERVREGMEIKVIRCSYHIISNFFKKYFSKNRDIFINYKYGSRARTLNVTKVLEFLRKTSKNATNDELKFLLETFSDTLCFSNAEYVSNINLIHFFSPLLFIFFMISN